MSTSFQKAQNQTQLDEQQPRSFAVDICDVARSFESIRFQHFSEVLNGVMHTIAKSSF